MTNFVKFFYVTVYTVHRTIRKTNEAANHSDDCLYKATNSKSIQYNSTLMIITARSGG